MSLFNYIESEYEVQTFTTVKIELIFYLNDGEGEENEELEEGQIESFLEFEKNIDATIFDAEYKLYDYYVKNCLEFRERVDEKDDFCHSFSLLNMIR